MLQNFRRESLAESGGNVQVLLQKARQWEEQGEYERAVECYLKVRSGPSIQKRHFINTSSSREGVL